MATYNLKYNKDDSVIRHIIVGLLADLNSKMSFYRQISNDEICLEIKLISISNLIILEIENILKKYQIQVNNYLDKRYVKYFFLDKQLDISQMAHNLKNGMNDKEVLITSKFPKKLGFFEKFFQLFG